MSLIDKTDSELVELSRNGDKDAFGQLSLRYEVMARRFALRLLSDEEIAKDIVQEAMLQAFLSLKSLKDPGRFKSWLCGIILNLSRNHLRDRKIAFFSLEAIIEGLSFFPAPFSAPILTPETIAEEREQYRTVLNAVNALSPADRDILLLFYYAQLSLPEIVRMLNLPAGTVKVRLHRARRRLKSVLEERYPEIIPPLKRRKIMVKVTIADVIKVEPKERTESPYESYVINLYDEAGRRMLPIWVGPAEGEAIAIGLSDLASSFPRPLTHRFFSSLLQGIDARMEEVCVVALKKTIFYAVVKIRTGKKTYEIDARPSDAIALAVLNDVPVYVAEEVFETAGIVVPATVKGPPNRKGLEKITRGLEERNHKYLALLNQRSKIRKLSEEDKAKRDEAIAAMFGE